MCYINQEGRSERIKCHCYIFKGAIVVQNENCSTYNSRFVKTLLNNISNIYILLCFDMKEILQGDL